MIKNYFYDTIYKKEKNGVIETMKKLFLPDYIIENYRELAPSFLLDRGINTLILDIDNTLVTYDDECPTSELYEWFSQLSQNGIKVAFVSNNSKERVDLFNSELSYIAFSKSQKPLVKNIKKAISLLGSTCSETALMGDQLFTDMMAGNRLGFLTILVSPIKDKTDVFTKLKRQLEKPLLKKYHKNTKGKM